MKKVKNLSDAYWVIFLWVWKIGLIPVCPVWWEHEQMTLWHCVALHVVEREGKAGMSSTCACRQLVEGQCHQWPCHTAIGAWTILESLNVLMKVAICFWSICCTHEGRHRSHIRSHMLSIQASTNQKHACGEEMLSIVHAITQTYLLCDRKVTEWIMQIVPNFGVTNRCYFKTAKVPTQLCF